MKLLMMVLNRQQSMEKALRALRKANVDRITVFDSESLGQYLGETDLAEETRPGPIGMRRTACKTIVCVLHDGMEFQSLKEKLIHAGVDLSQPEEGMMVTMPISESTFEEEERLRAFPAER